MKQLNPAHAAMVRAAINEATYFKLLDMEVTGITAGQANLEISVAEKHINPFGNVYGGIYASAIDTAAFLAVYSVIPAAFGLISLDLKVDYLAAGSKGKQFVSGTCVKVGRTVCLAEVEIKDESECLLAHGTSKLLVTEGLQTVDQALKHLGISVLDLPAKFL